MLLWTSSCQFVAGSYSLFPELIGLTFLVLFFVVAVRVMTLMLGALFRGLGWVVRGGCSAGVGSARPGGGCDGHRSEHTIQCSNAKCRRRNPAVARFCAQCGQPLWS